MKISSYPKVWNLGHSQVKELFNGTVIVQEKIDGSQISFGIVDNELFMRSKGAEIDLDAPQKMFSAAVEVVKSLASDGLLVAGWIYRGEYLLAPKHNTLVYDRIPRNHIILFDIQTDVETYGDRQFLGNQAMLLDLECVPEIYLSEDEVPDMVWLHDKLKQVSCLGGQTLEGVVIKNYGRFGVDGKALMGKYVSEAFKEVHGDDWKKRHPSNKDTLGLLADKYRTPARWDKAIVHAKEEGILTNTPRDIGMLIEKVNHDISEEEVDNIKNELWKWARKQILRRATQGLPEYYKEKLAEQQFSEAVLRSSE